MTLAATLLCALGFGGLWMHSAVRFFKLYRLPDFSNALAFAWGFGSSLGLSPYLAPSAVPPMWLALGAVVSVTGLICVLHHELTRGRP